MNTPTTARSKRRLAAAAGVAAAGLALTGGGVFAALNATAFNTTAETVGSGTLKLTLADNGAGFTTAIANLAPGDTVNRFINLTNGGTLDATALTLKVADTTGTNSRLTTDATLGLTATVSTCTVAWTTAGGCGGTTAAAFGPTALATLKTTPGAVLASLAAGANAFLKVSLVLPDQPETTTNGVLPSGTIQGLTASLVWTFTETQRTATTTSS